MGIKAKFNIADLRKYAQTKKTEFVEAAIEAYKVACIKMVDRAKSVGSDFSYREFKDQTHKLRSSIGCVLYHNGVEVFNYFESTGGDDGESGVQDGISYARSITERIEDKTIVAVVVAGAEYALYVESKGYDVLTGSTYDFADDLKEEFQNVKDAFKSHLEGKITG